jgi:hypothetical protein
MVLGKMAGRAVASRRPISETFSLILGALSRDDVRLHGRCRVFRRGWFVSYVTQTVVELADAAAHARPSRGCGQSMHCALRTTLVSTRRPRRALVSAPDSSIICRCLDLSSDMAEDSDVDFLFIEERRHSPLNNLRDVIGTLQAPIVDLNGRPVVSRTSTST